MKVTTTFLANFILIVSAVVMFAQDNRKPRVYVMESDTWSMPRTLPGGGILSDFLLGSRGGGSPQTAEIIKTFGKRCPESVVNISRENADYIVLLEHEGGKGLARVDNKFAIFDPSGDAIKSGSTRALGNSVADACEALKKDWQERKYGRVPHQPTAAPTPKPITSLDVREVGGTESTSAVTFQSDPDGADIEIDGKFAGNSPTLLQVSLGDHKISIKRPGYLVWERTIAVTAGGNVLVNAALEKSGAVVPVDAPAIAKPVPSSAIKAGEIRKNSIGLELVYLGSGDFMMGSSVGEKYEKPSHTVTFPDGFWMGKYEVKQSEWFVVMGSNPSSFDKCGGDCPVENVSWEDAKRFIEKLNAKNDGFVYSLPTEAQWEYAARAGAAPTSAGELDAAAWYGKNADGKTHPAGTKRPNAFGLYDMLGNVWEWCDDWYADYTVAAVTDPHGPDKGQYRVLRGGAWKAGDSDNRTTYRAALKPTFKYKDTGFRLVARPR